MDDQKEKTAGIVNGKQSLKYGIYHHYSSFTQENGITDGALEIDDPSFQEYLSFNHQRVLIENKIYLNEREIRETRAKIQEVNQNTALYIERKHQIAQDDEDILLRKQAIEEEKEKREKLDQKRKDLTVQYGLFAAILFLLVGFLFIAADLFLTKDILVNAMDFGKKDLDTWLLAGAIAGLAFALKPLVDYFVRQTREHGKNHKVILLYITSAIVIISLFFLGIYRTSYIYNDRLNEDLGNEIERQTNRLGGLSAIDSRNTLITKPLQTEIDQLKEKKEKLEFKLYSHWALIASIALLSFLFALVGAICFSISFPDLKIFWQKGWTYWKVLRSRRRIEKKEIQLRRAQTLRTGKLSDMDFAKEKIELMDQKIDGYHEELKTLKEREEKLLEQYAVALEEADKAWYKICKSRGIYYNHRNDYVILRRKGINLIKIIDKTLDIERSISPENSENGSTNGVKNVNTPYLYKYLRKSIGEQYSQRNGKVKLNPNGKDH
jgi:dolichol kinase